MLGKLMTMLATVTVAFFAATGFALAAVDVNTADQAQLESIKGIGPAISAKIIAERKKGSFKDWADLETRVSGVGDKNSAKFSEAGLTVGGKAKANAPAMSQSTATKTTTKSAVVPPSADVNSKSTMTTSKNAMPPPTPEMTKNVRSTVANPKSDAMDDTRSTKTTSMKKDDKANSAAASTETKTAKSKSNKGSGDTTSTDSTTTTTKK